MDRVGEIEKIEHELSESEECVACAYALKAKGVAKEILMEYLASEGFAIEGLQKGRTKLVFGLWLLRILVPLLGFLGTFMILRNVLSLPLAFVGGLMGAVLIFIIIEQVFGQR